MRRYPFLSAVIAGAALAMPLAAGGALAEGAFDNGLVLDPDSGTRISVLLDGAPLTLMRYQAVYAGQPVAMAVEQPARQMGPGGSPTAAKTQVLADPLAYQSLVVFVPETATERSAIILNVSNGGWFASELRPGIEDGGSYVSTSATDKAGAALKAGYVYVDVGTRGRGIVAADGTAPGKAPAAVVDAKAAIRWLRLNDAALPGSAERIVITGTSGGGGLSAVVGASGDSADFLPELSEIGAAGVAADGTSSMSDAVFAVIAYCPITDLGHADLAYEWLFRSARGAATVAGGQWSDRADAASAELAAGYADYLDGLGLKLSDGSALTAATMAGAIDAEVRAEVKRHLATGGTVPALGEPFTLQIRDATVDVPNTWLSVDGGKVTGIDHDAFVAFVATATALKPVPAFDRTANTGNLSMGGENSLFGAATQDYANFTPYGWNANEVPGDGSGVDDTGMDWVTWIVGPGASQARQLKLINPLAYLGTDAKAAPYWRIRHGMIDRDTAFAVPVALSRAVAGDPDVAEVDFAMPWMVGHSGDYDVQDAYDWLSGVLAKAGDPPG